MKKKIILTVSLLAFVLMFFGCAGKPDDTITKFATAINDNNPAAAGKLISQDAEIYPSLEANNWSGMLAHITIWKALGKISFSGFTDDINGSEAVVTCTRTSANFGDQQNRFKLVKESDFLFLIYSWKIKEWQDSSDVAGGTYQINKFKK